MPHVYTHTPSRDTNLVGRGIDPQKEREYIIKKKPQFIQVSGDRKYGDYDFWTIKPNDSNNNPFV